MAIDDLPVFDEEKYNKLKQELELIEVAKISAKGFPTSLMCVGGLYKNEESVYLILSSTGFDRNGKSYLGYGRLFMKKETIIEYRPLKRINNSN